MNDETLLSDHFHITYNSNGIITNLIPDSQNPEMKLYKSSEYIKLFIQDEMELFCKENHIPKFLWKLRGSIIALPIDITITYRAFAFQFKFLKKTFIKSIKISDTLFITL